MICTWVFHHRCGYGTLELTLGWHVVGCERDRRWTDGGGILWLHGALEGSYCMHTSIPCDMMILYTRVDTGMAHGGMWEGWHMKRDGGDSVPTWSIHAWISYAPHT